MTMKKLFILSILFTITSVAFSQRISELPPASTLNPADLIPIVQGGVTKKVTAGEIVQLIQDSLSNVRILSDSCLEINNQGALDTICFSGDPGLWIADGDDIENTNAGDITFNGQLYAPDIAPEHMAKFHEIVGYGVDKKLFPKSIIDLYNDTQDSLGKMPTPSPFITWVRDTANGELYPADMADNINIRQSDQGEAINAEGGIRLAAKRTEKCCIVFCDDDGDTAVWHKLLPIFSAKGVHGDLAINSSRHHATADNNYLTWSQLREFQNTYGWEIINHGYDHQNLVTILAAYGDDTVRKAIYMGRDQLRDSGLVVNNFCYAFSSENDTIRKIVREYHRAAIGRDYRDAPNYFDDYNRYPLETYRLTRFDFDGINWDAGYDPETVQYSVDSSKTYFYFRSIIDTAVKYGYNIQFMQHSRFLANDTVAFYDKDSILADHWTITAQIIDYILDSVNIPIYTLNEFLDSCGNLIDVGDPGSRNNWFAISADGEISRINMRGTNTVVGRWAGEYTGTNYNKTLFGYQAGAEASMDSVADALFLKQTAFGNLAGYKNRRGGQTAVGFAAGYMNTGIKNTSIGHEAGNTNTGSEVTCAGYQAGYHNTGNALTAFGMQAGNNNTGLYVTAMGRLAAYGNTQNFTTAFGSYAANGNTGTYPINVFGYWAGRNNSGIGLHAFGYMAGYGNSGTSVLAIGNSSAVSNTGNNCIFLGYFNGFKENTTANRFLLMNYVANNTPLLTGDLSLNRLGIGISKVLPDYNLEVTGDIYASTSITANTLLKSNDSLRVDNTLSAQRISMGNPDRWIDDFRQRPFYMTDFLSYAAAQYDIWRGTVVNGGAVVDISTSSTEHPGAVRIASSTTTNSGYYYLTGATAMYGLAGGEITNAVIRPLMLDSVTTRFGFHDAASVTGPVDGAFIQISPGGLATGETVNNSSGTTTTSNYSMSINTWYRLKIVATTSARIDFYIIDDAGAILWTDCLTTTIPTSGRALGHGIVSTKEASGTGSAVYIMYIDYMDVYFGNLTR